MDIELFIQKYYKNSTENQVNDVVRFLKSALEKAGNNDIKTLLSNDDYLIDIFFLQKNNNISRPHYQKIKNYIINLQNFYGIKENVPRRSIVIENKKNTTFFKDLPSLLDFIDEVGEKTSLEYNKNTDLVNLKSLVILGWLGITIPDIIDLNKSSITIINGEYILMYKNTKDKFIKLEKYQYDILNLYKYLDSYSGLPSGRKQYLKSNPIKLFRSISEDALLTERTILSIIGRFNSIIPHYDNVSIVFRDLKLNSAFVSVYEDREECKTVYEKLMYYMNCNKTMAYGYNTQYQRWLELYHR